MPIILIKVLFEQQTNKIQLSELSHTQPNRGGFPPFLSAHGADMFVKQHPLELEQKGGRTKTVQSCTQLEALFNKQCLCQSVIASVLKQIDRD